MMKNMTRSTWQHLTTARRRRKESGRKRAMKAMTKKSVNIAAHSPDKCWMLD
jgi:hypothetical protein